MNHSIKIPDKKLLLRILSFSKRKNAKVYLVGGYLRDIFLGRYKKNPDIDFCIRNKSIEFGRALSKLLKSGFVVLDKQRGCCRLVIKEKKRIITLDFTDFRGRSLKDDLENRDFSINSIALDLNKLTQNKLSRLDLIDIFGGIDDLGLKVIRAINKKTFDDDPLRILRAFSYASLFKFKISPATLKLIRAKKDKIKKVSYERIRDELFKILGTDCSAETIISLDKLKILGLIIPEIEIMRNVNQGPYHHLNVWNHSLETLRQLEILLNSLKDSQELKVYLQEIFSAERSRLNLLKLASLLHDIGKPQAKRRKQKKVYFHGHERIGSSFARTISSYLKLSRRETDALQRMVFWHLRPGYLADNKKLSERAKFRYFRDTQDEAASILLLSVADQRATKGRLTSKTSRKHHEKISFGLIKEFFQKKKEEKPQRLITGDDLIAKFKLKPSILIGKILERTAELQAIGKIKNKTEALREARKMIKL